MTEQERYLFDLQGFLVVPDALGADALAALNSLKDEHIAGDAPADMQTHRFEGLLRWGQPYLDLIDNPRITPYLEELLGAQFRLDHDYADVIRMGKGPIGTTPHGGGTPFDPSQFYRYNNGRLRNGLTVVAYNLKDVNPSDGGFACVPGSHKANLPFSNEWRDLSTLHPCVQPVVGPAGTAILFTEALTHGTLPWRSREERRTVFYKFSPNQISWSARYYDANSYESLTSGRPPSWSRPTRDTRAAQCEPDSNTGSARSIWDSTPPSPFSIRRQF
jgi:ectoine hydroxylase-related dioxygenase (phytanoyl-CoA dioxygenase family)